MTNILSEPFLLNNCSLSDPSMTFQRLIQLAHIYLHFTNSSIMVPTPIISVLDFIRTEPSKSWKPCFKRCFCMVFNTGVQDLLFLPNTHLKCLLRGLPKRFHSPIICKHASEHYCYVVELVFPKDSVFESAYLFFIQPKNNQLQAGGQHFPLLILMIYVHWHTLMSITSQSTYTEASTRTFTIPKLSTSHTYHLRVWY